MKKIYLTLAVCLGLLQGANAAEIATNLIAGGWTWKFTMPDGTVVRPELELTQTNGVWTGQTSLGAGSATAVTNLVIADGRIRFEVARERDDRVITTRYAGEINDGQITGKIESNWTGDWQTYDWRATHLSREIEGRWSWGGRSVELTLAGQELKGKVFLEGNAEYPLLNGSFSNGQVQFKIERESDGQPYINIFRAKLAGQMLKGEIERILPAETNRNDWEARRVK